VKYEQKDLGYKRTPTTAQLHVEMGDGATWSVPLQLVADSRDEFYRDEKEDSIALLRTGELPTHSLIAWAVGTLNWEQVKEYAHWVPDKQKTVDYEGGWVRGDKEIIGEI
jgi:hypothetical protein